MRPPPPAIPVTRKFRADLFAIFVFVLIGGALLAQVALIAGLS